MYIFISIFRKLRKICSRKRGLDLEGGLGFKGGFRKVVGREFRGGV